MARFDVRKGLAPGVALLWATLVMMLPWTASATTMVYADVERLTEISSLIVEGEVVGQRTWRVDEGGIFTEWTVSVDVLHKGSADSTVRFRQWGGSVDDEFTFIPGDARFQVGERVMVFLHADEEGMHWLSALGQSKFLIGGGSPPVGPTVDLETALQQGIDLDPMRIRRVDLPALDAPALRDLRSLSFYDSDRSHHPVFHFDSVEVMRHGELVERVRAAVRAQSTR